MFHGILLIQWETHKMAEIRVAVLQNHRLSPQNERSWTRKKTVTSQHLRSLWMFWIFPNNRYYTSIFSSSFPDFYQQSPTSFIFWSDFSPGFSHSENSFKTRQRAGQYGPCWAAWASLWCRWPVSALFRHGENMGKDGKFLVLNVKNGGMVHGNI